VLEQELLFDPCIDIVGNALPNYFVDGGGNTPREFLSSGEVVGSTVRIRCWRVAAQDIPQTVDERLRWLFAQWGNMNTFVRNARETK